MSDPDFSGITFIDENERLYFAQAKLANDVLLFLRSPVGRYLHGRAKQQYEEAKEGALKCNPNSFFGRRKLKKLQQEAAQAHCFMQWCTDIISEGEFATQELEQYRG